MSRCSIHRIPEPCFYCERGLPTFPNLEARMEVLEDRVRELELGERVLLSLDVRKTNLVVRMGGIGDLAILSSSLKALKEKEPRHPLVLATKPEHMEVLAGAEYLDGIIPVNIWGDAKVHRRYDLRYAVEPPGIGPGKLSWKDYTSRDRSDIFDDLLGVKSKKEFSIHIDQDSLLQMEGLVADCRRPIIGIAPTCRSPIRVMPPEHVVPLSRLLLAKYGGTVVLLGKTEPWNSHLAKIKMRRVLNLLDRINIPETVALCSLLDVLISPDTGTTHIAGALGIKCLALFGNIHPKTRISYYSSVKALFPEGELPCIPCWDKPDFCPREEKFGGPCMRLLTPERIVTALHENFLKVAA
jgi:ADP-heptose:LPS heptosyltransferase